METRRWPTFRIKVLVVQVVDVESNGM